MCLGNEGKLPKVYPQIYDVIQSGVVLHLQVH